MPTNGEKDQGASVIDARFFPVSPLMIFPRSQGNFGVYINVNGRYMLYAHPEEPFTEEHRHKLYENGVEQIYILTNQKQQFEQYIEDHLGDFLNDESLPVKERSRVFYNASVDILKETFETRLPENLSQESFQKILRFVTEGSGFLSRPDSLKNLANLISHDYYTYSHCVHVFIYAMAIMQSYEVGEQDLVSLGMGAILHDLGKARIAKSILTKPGKLTKLERARINEHPMLGVSMCTHIPLSQEALNCILFHHERFDGNGYPSGLCSEAIPLGVRAVTVCDAYDAMTTRRPYAEAKSPYETLNIMRDSMPGHFDPEILRRFVVILSGADLV